jgi:hypothetical protein
MRIRIGRRLHASCRPLGSIMRVRTIQPDTIEIGNKPLHVLRKLLVSPEILPLRSCQGLYQDEIYERAVWQVRHLRACQTRKLWYYTYGKISFLYFGCSCVLLDTEHLIGVLG